MARVKNLPEYTYVDCSVNLLIWAVSVIFYLDNVKPIIWHWPITVSLLFKFVFLIKICLIYTTLRVLGSNTFSLTPLTLIVARYLIRFLHLVHFKFPPSLSLLGVKYMYVCAVLHEILPRSLFILFTRHILQLYCPFNLYCEHVSQVLLLLLFIFIAHVCARDISFPARYISSLLIISAYTYQSQFQSTTYYYITIISGH